VIGGVDFKHFAGAEREYELAGAEECGRETRVPPCFIGDEFGRTGDGIGPSGDVLVEEFIDRPELLTGLGVQGRQRGAVEHVQNIFDHARRREDFSLKNEVGDGGAGEAFLNDCQVDALQVEQFAFLGFPAL